MIERIFILKRTEIFGDLSHEILGSLSSHMEDVSYDDGETIFEKGDLGHTLYVVVEGTVRIHDGDRTLAEMGANEVLGEVTALTSEARTASATAKGECRLLKLDQDVLYELMSGQPGISRSLIRVLVERLN